MWLNLLPIESGRAVVWIPDASHHQRPRIRRDVILIQPGMRYALDDFHHSLSIARISKFAQQSLRIISGVSGHAVARPVAGEKPE